MLSHLEGYKNQLSSNSISDNESPTDDFCRVMMISFVITVFSMIVCMIFIEFMKFIKIVCFDSCFPQGGANSGNGEQW